MPSSLATSGTEALRPVLASAWRSLRTICSGVCLFFIESPPPSAHLGPLDSHSSRISFRGAGHQALDPNGVAITSDQSGIKNVNSDPGQYYIQIISSQVEWSLRVEDCANTTTGTTGTTTGTSTTGTTGTTGTTTDTRLRRAPPQVRRVPRVPPPLGQREPLALP